MQVNVIGFYGDGLASFQTWAPADAARRQFPDAH
jgi:hypothetical protein